MKKFSTNNTSKILNLFIIKDIIMSILTILIFSFIASEIVYNLDIDLNSTNIISVIIVALSSFIIGFISVYGIKNNGVLFGIISQIPLLFYMTINLIFHNSSILLFFIKIAIIALMGCLSGIIASSKSKKIKV